MSQIDDLLAHLFEQSGVKQSPDVKGGSAYLQNLDPETKAGLEITSKTPEGFFSPDDQMEMTRRRGQALQLMLDGKRQGVSFAHDSGNNRISDVNNPQVSGSLGSHSNDVQSLYDLYDLSPFKSSGMSETKPASLNGFGDTDADRIARKGVPDFTPLPRTDDYEKIYNLPQMKLDDESPAIAAIRRGDR